MNTNEIDSLIIEAFLNKMDLSEVEAWVRRQTKNEGIVLNEVYCIRVILDWMMDKSQEEREMEI
jgi:hypothetical protein